MIQTFQGKIKWIDLVNPSEEEINALKTEFKLHPIIMEELKGPSSRAKVAFYNNYLYFVSHFPNWNPKLQTSEPYELDFIISKDFLITASYQPETDMRQELLEQVCSREFEEKYLNGTTVELLYFIILNFLEFTAREIAHINDKLEEISNLIFKTRSQLLIEKIAATKRDILDFRRIYRFLKNILSSLSRLGPRVLGEETRIYFDDLLGESLKVEDAIENFADTINSLENTYNSLVQNRINSFTRIYTLLSFVTWPTLIIISSFQMNAKYAPIVGLPYDYFILVGLAFLPSLIFYLILKRKKLI